LGASNCSDKVIENIRIAKKYIQNVGIAIYLQFGANDYASEFSRIPYEVFLPILRDDSFKFLTEEELPDGYKPGEIIF
jgi:hypothetical protein